MKYNPSWLVEGEYGAHWIVARDGDEACEKYRGRFSLPISELDCMTVVAVKRDVRERPELQPDPTDPADVALHEKLYATSDARVWAEEFGKLFVVVRSNYGYDDDPVDTVGLMTTWFANAIESTKIREWNDGHPTMHTHPKPQEGSLRG